jgi:hypothetical protein
MTNVIPCRLVVCGLVPLNHPLLLCAINLSQMIDTSIIAGEDAGMRTTNHERRHSGTS